MSKGELDSWLTPLVNSLPLTHTHTHTHTHTQGHSDVVFSDFEVSPDNQIIAFVGKDGYIPLVSNKVRTSDQVKVIPHSASVCLSVCASFCLIDKAVDC